MKIQFSLRTLIVACLIAGVGVWYGVQSYLSSVPSPELTARREAIWSPVEALMQAKQFEYSAKPKYTGSSNGPHYSSGINRWSLCGRSEVVIDNKRIPLFSFCVRCERKRIEITPVEIEYDGAVENEAVVQKIKAICDEKKWPCVIRKVDMVNR